MSEKKRCFLFVLLVIATLGCEKEEEEPLPENKPPQCTIQSPQNGAQYLQGVTLQLTVLATDSDGSIDQVLFYAGENALDSISNTSDTVTIYEFDWQTAGEPLGMHALKAVAVDDDGDATEDKITINIIENTTNTAPTAFFNFAPPAGITGEQFFFDASKSTDFEDSTHVLEVRWDFEGDSNWDTDFDATKTIDHQYTETGNFEVKMEVRDSGGLSDTASKTLIVTNGGEPCPGMETIEFEGQEYNTVLIGDQCWLKENMNVGTMINNLQDQTPNGVIEKYCYNNDAANCDEFGGLYQWDEVMQTDGSGNYNEQGICPPGWHVATDEDWKLLEGTVDSQYEYDDPVWENTGFRGFDGGRNIKADTAWSSGGNGTNIFGFTSLPAGFRHPNGDFHNLGNFSYFWTSTSTGSNNAYYRGTSYFSNEIFNDEGPGSAGRSARCILDQ